MARSGRRCDAVLGDVTACVIDKDASVVVFKYGGERVFEYIIILGEGEGLGDFFLSLAVVSFHFLLRLFTLSFSSRVHLSVF